MLICYGARMPNALLMLHYGFMDRESQRAAPDGVHDPGREEDPREDGERRGAFAEEGDTQGGVGGEADDADGQSGGRSRDKAADLACIGAMRGAADAKLASFPTPAEEDEVALSAGELGERMRMCVEYRLSVKRNVEAFGRFLAKMEEVVE